jgi:hypothetical protein
VQHVDCIFLAILYPYSHRGDHKEEATMAQKTVAGVFRTPGEAEQAVNALRQAGYNINDVSVVAREREQAREVAEQTGAEIGTGAAAGAGVGAGVGAVISAVAGAVGAVAIPGIGVVAGPLAAGAVGAVGGAVAGGLVGALVGWGFDENEAREYEDAIKRGDILLAVRVPEEGSTGDAEEIFRRSGGHRVSSGTVD